MLIDVNKWIDKNGSFDEAGGLDLVRHGYEWIRRMRKFENKADRHTFQKVFGNTTILCHILSRASISPRQVNILMGNTNTSTSIVG